MNTRSDSSILAEVLQKHHLDVAKRWDPLYWLFGLAGGAVGGALGTFVRMLSAQVAPTESNVEALVILAAFTAIGTCAGVVTWYYMRRRAILGPLPPAALVALRDLSPEGKSDVARAMHESAAGVLDQARLMQLFWRAESRSPRHLNGGREERCP